MIEPLYNLNLALWLEICFLLWNNAQLSYLSSLMQSALLQLSGTPFPAHLSAATLPPHPGLL